MLARRERGAAAERTRRDPAVLVDLLLTALGGAASLPPNPVVPPGRG